MSSANLADIEAVLDTLATPVVVWDFDGHVLASNTAAARLTGYTLAQMRQVSQAMVVHPEDLLEVPTAKAEPESASA